MPHLCYENNDHTDVRMIKTQSVRRITDDVPHPKDHFIVSNNNGKVSTEHYINNCHSINATTTIISNKFVGSSTRQQLPSPSPPPLPPLLLGSVFHRISYNNELTMNMKTHRNNATDTTWGAVYPSVTFDDNSMHAILSKSRPQQRVADSNLTQIVVSSSFSNETAARVAPASEEECTYKDTKEDYDNNKFTEKSWEQIKDESCTMGDEEEEEAVVAVMKALIPTTISAVGCLSSTRNVLSLQRKKSELKYYESNSQNVNIIPDDIISNHEMSVADCCAEELRSIEKNKTGCSSNIYEGVTINTDHNSSNKIRPHVFDDINNIIMMKNQIIINTTEVDDDCSTATSLSSIKMNDYEDELLEKEILLLPPSFRRLDFPQSFEKASSIYT